MEMTSNNLTKFDKINAQNSLAFKDIPENSIIHVRAAAIITDPIDGKDYSYLWTEEGECYAGNSKSVTEAIPDIIDLINEGTAIDAEIIARHSKAGQTFLCIRVYPRG